MLLSSSYKLNFKGKQSILVTESRGVTDIDWEDHGGVIYVDHSQLLSLGVTYASVLFYNTLYMFE
jgi:hypothetical protein